MRLSLYATIAAVAAASLPASAATTNDQGTTTNPPPSGYTSNGGTGGNLATDAQGNTTGKRLASPSGTAPADNGMSRDKTMNDSTK